MAEGATKLLAGVLYADGIGLCSSFSGLLFDSCAAPILFGVADIALWGLPPSDRYISIIKRVCDTYVEVVAFG